MIQALPLQTGRAAAWMAEPASWAAKVALRPIQILIAAPVFLYLAALTAMLLRSPEVRFYQIDRVAFGILAIGVVARGMILRRRVLVFERASWPMIGLAVLALISAARQPFDNEMWSVLASKFIVPFVLFHLAALVFTREQYLRRFETFSLLILAYLTLTAIAFLCGQYWLIFPRFILNNSLGIHIDRARGPFLQAVANGVSLNILALLALHAYRRRQPQRRTLLLLLASVPVAILATMTRAVWLAFAVSVVVLIFSSRTKNVARRLLVAVLIGAVGLVMAMNSDRLGNSLTERLQEGGPVEFREAVYAASWEMFQERPLLGWGFHQMPAELPRHVSGYQEKVFYPHNTYLELLTEHGMVGFALYLWLMYEIWQLGRGAVPRNERNGFLNADFRRLWPIILVVYWINAAVVVMSYQFVNGLLFTIAGMLAAQRRRAQLEEAR